MANYYYLLNSIMEEIQLDSVVLGLSDEHGNVRVVSGDENVILANQTIENVSELIKHNFSIVNNHYQLIINQVRDDFNITDINRISLSIVMYYLYTYNLWRGMHKRQANKDLRFNEKDFKDVSTYDIVCKYYKKIYPTDWEEKSRILLAIEIDEFNSYYKERQYFYTK